MAQLIKRERWVILGLIALFFALNLVFLTRFPFVHSDESWLSGLTRAMQAEGSIGVTEPFFDLKPRYPHAIKTLFHLMQMPLFHLFGYGIFPARLLSLLFGSLCLWLFYQCARQIASFPVSILCAAMLACDVSFLVASHLARQEIVVSAGLLSALFILLSREGPLTNRDIWKLSAATGLMAGVHPNAFVIAAMAGCVLLWRCWAKKATGRNILHYIAATGLFAGVFAALSFLLDPQFIAHYGAYAKTEFDLTLSLADRLKELPLAIARLWLGVSGTYYIPELRPTFLFGGALFIAGGVMAVKTRRAKGAEGAHRHHSLCTLLAAILGLSLGTVAIGRYNQTSFAFFILPGLLLWPAISGALRPRIAASAALIACTALVSLVCVFPWLSRPYGAYTAAIEALVPKNAKVLANLNAEYAFDYGKLLDYRNLSFLKERGMSVEEYLVENQVEYVLLSDELDAYYAVRPTLNVMYGNLRYLPALQAYLREHATLVGRFVNNTYAVRLRRMMNTKRDFTVSVWRLPE